MSTDQVRPRQRGPIPPRSRHRWHLLGIAFTLVAGPLSFVLLAGAVPDLLASPSSADRPLALFATVGAALLLAGSGWLGSRSSVAAATAGAVWLALGVLSVLLPGFADWLTHLLPEQLGPFEPQLGAAFLLSSGGSSAVGAALLCVSIGTTAARQRGRARERHELKAHLSGDVRVPPRLRLASHLTASILAIALTVPAVSLLNIAAAENIAPVRLVGLEVRAGVVVALVAVAVAGSLGSLSSLGPAFAGALWLASAVQVLAGGTTSFVSRSGMPIAQLLPSLEQQGQFGADASGVSLAVALALLGGALGAHFARRDGRATQRSENAVALAQTTAA